MASLSQCRCLAGSKAFTGVRPRAAPVVANGGKVFMKRKDSYMVEVNVGEDEPEDIAVRKFMKKMMESRLIDQLRARRYLETMKECFKRRTRERIERIKNKVVDATWEEEYGRDVEAKPFQDFFPSENYSDAAFFDNMYTDEFLNSAGGYLTDSGAGGGGGWGNYINTQTPRWGNNLAQGGYLAQQPAAGYGNYGGYGYPPEQQQQQQQKPPADQGQAY